MFLCIYLFSYILSYIRSDIIFIAVLFSANYLVNLNNIYIYISHSVIPCYLLGACLSLFLNKNVEDFLVVFLT